MINIILGKRSFISRNLDRYLKNSIRCNIEEFIEIQKKIKRFNLIFNSFYPISKLENIKNVKDYEKKCIGDLSFLLENLKLNKLNKFIYTSSASVYGIFFQQNKVLSKRDLYGSFKFASENLVKEFFLRKKFTKYIIARIFNIYGGDESFSIISKLKKAKIQNRKLTIYNRGESVRDFIHIDDLCKIYAMMLKKKENGVIDIGTGKGTKILNLLSKLKFDNKKIIYKKNKFENSYSVADTLNLSKILKVNKLKSVERFLKLKKDILERYSAISKNENNGLAIYGCGFSGLSIARELIKIDKKKISYFVDDDPSKIGKKFLGIKVISFSFLKYLAKNNKIKNVIFAIPSLTEKKSVSILAKLYSLSLSVSFLPEKKFFKSRNVEKIFLQKFNFENLLNRDVYKLSSKTLEQFKNKIVFITGGAGSIGSQICIELLKSRPKKIILYDNSEFNIFQIDEKLNNPKIEFILGDTNDESNLFEQIKKYKIDYLFHAAAYKHVKYCENNVCESVKNNIFSTLKVLNSIKNTSVKFVFISTDKAVNPKNVLGMTKRIAELAIISNFKNNPNYKKNKIKIVRFGNVLGSAGSAIPKFIDQIKKDKPITITDVKMKRYFMNISEAANLVIESTNINHKKDQIFLLKMGNQIKIVNIARQLFEYYKNKNQRFRLKIIGNKNNEKIGEKLSITQKVNQTRNRKILLVNDPTYNQNIIDDLLDKLNLSLDLKDNVMTLKILKNFFKSFK